MTLVYLDCETTGLDPDRHEVWELAYAVDDGPIESGVLWHSLRHADPTALAMNGYFDRTKGVDAEQCMSLELEVRETLQQGATLVGANPAFDAAFLRARWGAAPWRYRMLDVEAYAMGALGYQVPQGLKTVTASLLARGFDIPEPDHTAAGDVATLRACHLALVDIYAGRAVERGARP